MHAVISCVDHDHTRRRIHDMCDVDANGEVCGLRPVLIHLLIYHTERTASLLPRLQTSSCSYHLWATSESEETGRCFRMERRANGIH